MIKAVIFDIGGVLSRWEDRGFAKSWEARLGLAAGELHQIVFDNPTAKQAMVGRATRDAMWRAAQQKLGISDAELQVLKVEIWQDYVWDTALIDFVRALRGRGMLTAVLSDAWSGARESIAEQINATAFDLIVFSCEEGLQKPAPETYKRTLLRLGVAANEAIFIDDRQKNVAGARAVGIHAFQFKDAQTTQAEITKLLKKAE